jgi:endonuclease/exonuclease/phosphatase family metal-dependent hydrolase
MVLRGRWCNIIVLNAHAPTEEKSDDSKDSFYEELEQVFDHFPKYHMKILLGDFNAKLGRKDTFKSTIGNESLHQDSKDNGVRVVNFATSKNLVLKSTMFPLRNIHKYTRISPDGKNNNQIDHVLIGDGIQVYSMCDLSGELTVILITIWCLQKLGKDWR